MLTFILMQLCLEVLSYFNAIYWLAQKVKIPLQRYLIRLLDVHKEVNYFREIILFTSVAKIRFIHSVWDNMYCWYMHISVLSCTLLTNSTHCTVSIHISPNCSSTRTHMRNESLKVLQYGNELKFQQADCTKRDFQALAWCWKIHLSEVSIPALCNSASYIWLITLYLGINQNYISVHARVEVQAMLCTI